ncbi:heparan-alpha-glucosaminide N-acetyltransferase domain-containing protein [Aquimarina sp. W85]|uniref:heparan-alpha-glucosaminide N-acetyltransferase domain-containing protein n=1 Tax=Aquimarina rhodophyticola TaxID=3342246 RepID=UPI0036728AA0
MNDFSNRVHTIDFARGLSVFLIAIVHTLWMYGDLATQSDTWLGYCIHTIGKGTPIFLLVMGFSYTLSRNQSLKLSCKRALILLAAGYGMNFLKFHVPILLGIMPENFIAAYGWTTPLSWKNLLYLFGTGDILQLAGVSLLFMGVINYFSVNKWIPLFIAFCILIATPYVRGLMSGIDGLDYLLAILWSDKWDIYFAIFPWFTFILVGMFFGRWYHENQRNQKFIFSRMLSIGLITLIIGLLMCFYDYKYHFGDYFHLGQGGVIYLTGFNLIILWISYQIVSRSAHNSIFSFLYYCSERVTSIYIIQWVVICWGMSVLGYQQFGVIGILILIPIVLVITLMIQKLVDLLKNSEIL